MATPAPSIVRIAQYDGNRGLKQRQAVETANQRRLNLAPNTEFDRRLVKTDTWRSEKEVYPAWSGLMAAYEAPNKKMERFVTYTDPNTDITYAIEANPKAIGAKNLALAVNHLVDAQSRPLIEYEDKGDKNVLVKVEPSKLKIVEAFPTKDGWYIPELEFGIPVGKEVSADNPDARYLVRVDDGSYVGLAARGYVYILYNYRRDVYLVGLPSYRAGVLGISTGAQAPAAEKLAHSGVELNGLVADAQAAVQRMVGVVEQGLILPVQKLIDAVQQKQ